MRQVPGWTLGSHTVEVTVALQGSPQQVRVAPTVWGTGSRRMVPLERGGLGAVQRAAARCCGARPRAVGVSGEQVVPAGQGCPQGGAEVGRGTQAGQNSSSGPSSVPT